MGSNPIALTIKIKKLTVLVTMAGSIAADCAPGSRFLKNSGKIELLGPCFV
jgi:hypothetical protein